MQITVTSKVSKIRKEVQDTKDIISNELVTCSKNGVLMESIHNCFLEYKGNCQNKTLIKNLVKKMTF